jgi:hypothetical protein
MCHYLQSMINKYRSLSKFLGFCGNMDEVSVPSWMWCSVIRYLVPRASRPPCQLKILATTYPGTYLQHPARTDTSSVTSVTKMKCGVTTLSAEVPLFFNIIPEHTDAFTPFWHEFKNSVTIKIGLLHSQPITSSHFHFITVESGPPLCRFSGPNCSKTYCVWRVKWCTMSHGLSRVQFLKWQNFLTSAKMHQCACRLQWKITTSQ